MPIWIDEVAPRVPGVEQYRDLDGSGLNLVCMRATAKCECMSLLMHYRIIVHYWNWESKQTALENQNHVVYNRSITF